MGKASNQDLATFTDTYGPFLCPGPFMLMIWAKACLSDQIQPGTEFQVQLINGKDHADYGQSN